MWSRCEGSGRDCIAAYAQCLATYGRCTRVHRRRTRAYGRCTSTQYFCPTTSSSTDFSASTMYSSTSSMHTIQTIDALENIRLVLDDIEFKQRRKTGRHGRWCRLTRVHRRCTRVHRRCPEVHSGCTTTHGRYAAAQDPFGRCRASIANGSSASRSSACLVSMCASRMPPSASSLRTESRGIPSESCSLSRSTSGSRYSCAANTPFAAPPSALSPTV
jgi:hypothetical protein